MNPTVSTWEPNHTRISALFAHEPMPENRGHAQSKRSITPREIFLPAEVYISNQAAAALRKVPCLFCCGVSLIQRSRNSLIHARGQRRESPRDLCPCYATIIKERLKVCRPTIVAKSYPVLRRLCAPQRNQVG